MKLVRVQPLLLASPPPHEESRAAIAPRFAVLEGETAWEIRGPFEGERIRTGRSWPMGEVRLLPPVVPTKVVCQGRNYREHAAELNNPVPKEPMIFLKPPSSVIGPEEPILLPEISKHVDFEGEIAAVIGRSCSRLGETDEVAPYVLGYTCLDDVTARDLQKADGRFTRAKGFDTFCPLGPAIETDFDLAGATVATFVNGVRRQFGRTAEMIFSVDAIIRWVSRIMTLVPGDVVATGTPAGVGPLAHGDVVEVVVSGIGTLRNPVARRED
ncbi:MAG TPA: fumarylacetoacetate hydrolase family protein [Candidatus Acidoferrales bacterium]|nr:fumarylacetoacetate hydrolase family protein [Candidatus Acidoferrales bacterium]